MMGFAAMHHHSLALVPVYEAILIAPEIATVREWLVQLPQVSTSRNGPHVFDCTATRLQGREVRCPEIALENWSCNTRGK